MNRRNFLANTTATSAFIALGGLSLNSCILDTKKKITILHTNDVHSHIDPFPQEHSEFPNLGGLARRATLVEAIRKENDLDLDRLFNSHLIIKDLPLNDVNFIRYSHFKTDMRPLHVICSLI